MIETVRVSPSGKDQLVSLKRRTGLKHWNELCRWALCRSLSEPSVPSDVPIHVEGGLEIDWRTFGGTRADLYLGLVRARCARDGLGDSPEVVGRYFRLHLHRGIGYLAGDQSLRSTNALLEMAVKSPSGVRAPPELAVRGRTALGRVALSRPLQRALDDHLIVEGSTVFDYGCGRGGDIERLRRRGFQCSGWDPVHRPRAERTRARVVNLGYVVNVIEDLEERRDVLRRAFALADEVLVVSARLEDEARDLVAQAEHDGLRTTTGTFQKFFRQEELRVWVEHQLGAPSLAAAPGVLYVFKDPVLEQAFLARRVRRTVRLAPVSKRLFQEHEDLISGLMAFVARRGRLPRSGELKSEDELVDAFGTIRNAWATVRRVTGDEPWDRVRSDRSADLLVYLALSQVSRRPPRPSELPDELRLDVRDLFGNHKSALEQAHRLLFATGNDTRVREAVAAAVVGKTLPHAHYVHIDALGQLPPVLRVLDGLARALIGEIEATTLIKFHLDKPAVSYLAYPAFDDHPHPALESGYVVRLDHLHVKFRNYAGHPNPAVLHRKELFLDRDDPRRQRFARLTLQEEKAGLYAKPSVIGRRDGWERVLAEAGRSHAGHRLVRGEGRTS